MELLIKEHFYFDDEVSLSIDEEKICFKDKTILSSKITGIRNWSSPLEFYHFTIGRKYYLGFRSEAELIEIVLTSYFGIRSKYFKETLNKILDEVWEPITQK